MFCILLHIELEKTNLITALGVLIGCSFLRYSFCPPNKYKSTKQAFWCARSLQGVLCSSGCLEYIELPNLLSKNVKAKDTAKRTGKCKILGV